MFNIILSSQQVIAVVMDIFTDVDIFSDLLDAAARHVPVYILLDEHNAHHFVSMVTSLKINLDMIHVRSAKYFFLSFMSFYNTYIAENQVTVCAKRHNDL